MTADKLFVYMAQNIGEIKLTGFLGNLGVQADLKQEVPQLLTESVRILLLDRLQRLICLFDEIGFERLVGLDAVPGATVGGT
ncbi:MAG: hypothetical protein DDT27_01428 [Dehalococcoidia bacterium]|nr:hypothetical protein [Chloroflexota bacterium]MBT9162863.1 hypothetical protein [Chloroflexota bacterium]